MSSFQNTWRPLNSTVISNCFISQDVNPSLLGAANLKKTNATYYYEVTILSYPESLDKLSFGYIGLDHCVDDLRLISKQESLLFHYNGEVSINQNCVNFFHDGFKTNDVIGCGLEIGEENKGFFTCNSELIFSFSNFCRNDMHYYPALFCDGDKDTITFESNFGEMSFEYYNQNIINSIDNINNEINADDTILPDELESLFDPHDATRIDDIDEKFFHDDNNNASSPSHIATTTSTISATTATTTTNITTINNNDNNIEPEETNENISDYSAEALKNMLRDGSEAEALKAVEYILRLCDSENYRLLEKEEQGLPIIAANKITDMNKITELFSNGVLSCLLVAVKYSRDCSLADFQLSRAITALVQFADDYSSLSELLDKILQCFHKLVHKRINRKTVSKRLSTESFLSQRSSSSSSTTSWDPYDNNEAIAIRKNYSNNRPLSKGKAPLLGTSGASDSLSENPGLTISETILHDQSESNNQPQGSDHRLVSFALLHIARLLHLHQTKRKLSNKDKAVFMYMVDHTVALVHSLCPNASRDMNASLLFKLQINATCSKTVYYISLIFSSEHKLSEVHNIKIIVDWLKICVDLWPKYRNFDTAGLSKPSLERDFASLSQRGDLAGEETEMSDRQKQKARYSILQGNAIAMLDRRTSSVGTSPVKDTDQQASPVDSSHVKDTDQQASPVDSSHVMDTDQQASPVDSSHVMDTDQQASPVDSSPVKDTDQQASPVDSSPVKNSSLSISEDYPAHISLEKDSAILDLAQHTCKILLNLINASLRIQNRKRRNIKSYVSPQPPLYGWIDAQMMATGIPTLLSTLIQSSCNYAYKLCQPISAEDTSTTGTVVKFSLPLQSGIDIVAVFSALSRERANRLELAQTGIPKALCCLMIDAVGRLKQAEKVKKTWQSDNQHEIKKVEQQEAEVQRYIHDLLIVILNYLSDETTLNEQLSFDYLDSNIPGENISVVSCFPYVMKALLFVCTLRNNEAVQVASLDVILSILRSEHILKISQLEVIAKTMNQVMRQRPTENNIPLSDEVTQKICESLAIICESNRHFVQCFLNEVDLFKIMLLKAKSQNYEIRFQALRCVSAMCSLVANCSFRGILSTILELAACTPTGLLSYFPRDEDVIKSEESTADIVEKELHMITNIRKHAAYFIESLGVFSKAVEEANVPMKVVALKGLSYLATDNKLSVLLITGSLRILINILSDPKSPANVTSCVEEVLVNLGFKNGKKDVEMSQQNDLVMISWFTLRRAMRPQHLTIWVFQFMNEQYLQAEESEKLDIEQYAYFFERFLLSSVLDSDSLQLEKRKCFMKHLNDAIIEGLQLLANQDFFLKATCSFEKLIEYFLVEIKDSFIKFLANTYRHEASDANIPSSTILPEAVRRTSFAQDFIVSCFSKAQKQEFIQVADDQCFLDDASTLLPEEVNKTLEMYYPKLLQRKSLSVLEAGKTYHNKFIGHRIVEGALDLNGAFPKRVLLLPPGLYSSFKVIGSAVERWIEECSGTDKWELTFRHSTFDGDFYDDMLETLTNRPEICFVKFICQKPKPRQIGKETGKEENKIENEEQKGKEVQQLDSLERFLSKLPPNILTMSIELSLTEEDTDNLCDLLKSKDTISSLQSFAIGHQSAKEERYDKKEAYDLKQIQILDPLNNCNTYNNFAELTEPSNQLSTVTPADACGGDFVNKELTANLGFMQLHQDSIPSTKSQLCHLSLSSTSITKETVCNIFSCLWNNSTLLTIDLSNNNITSSFELNNHLKWLLQRNDTLKKLDMSKNKLNNEKYGTTRTLTSVMNGLSANRTIQFICLEENCFTNENDDEIYQKINEYLKKNRTAVLMLKQKSSPAPESSQNNLQNRLCVFFSSPLVRPITKTNQLQAIRILNFAEEKNVITQAFTDARQDITVHFNFATTTLLSESLTADFRALHISGHGNIQGFLFEDGHGGIHLLTPQNIINKCKIVNKIWDFVFIASCHSEVVGRAFVAAGVPHVICVETNSEDTPSNTFSRALYFALAKGKTVQEAFDIGKQTVIDCPRVLEDQKTADSVAQAEKFLLLPPGDSHNVRIFNAGHVAIWPSRVSGSPANFPFDFPRTDLIPRLPVFFVGRGVVTYKLVNDVLKNQVVQLQGEAGVGKSVLAAAAGRYMLERRMFEDGVIFVELTGVETFQEFLTALIKALRRGSPKIKKKMKYLQFAKDSYSLSGSSDGKSSNQPQQDSGDIYRERLHFLEKSEIRNEISDFSIHDFVILCEEPKDSIKLLKTLLFASLRSANVCIILDHTNALTYSSGKRNSDCILFLDFINNLLNQSNCSNVRVLLTTTDSRSIGQGSCSFSEIMTVLPVLNMIAAVELFLDLSKVLESEQRKREFIENFTCKWKNSTDDYFKRNISYLLGGGNPSMIRRAAFNSGSDVFNQLNCLIKGTKSF